MIKLANRKNSKELNNPQSISILTNMEVKLHSNVAQSLGNVCKLYYLLRALDPLGTGCVTIDPYVIMQINQISRSTLNRYLKDDRVIREIIKHSNTSYTIYYKSLCKVALSTGIDNLGGIGFVTVNDLLDWRQSATLIHALKLQQQSIYCAKFYERRKKGVRSLIKPERIFNAKQQIVDEYDPTSLFSTDSFYFGKRALLRTNRLYLNIDSHLPYGVTHRAIANELQVNERTVLRRLKEVNKVHQAVTKSTYNFVKEYFQFIDEEDWSYQGGKYFTFPRACIGGTTFRSYCDIYEESITLTSSKQLRRKFKSLLGKTFGYEIVTAKEQRERLLKRCEEWVEPEELDYGKNAISINNINSKNT